VSGEYPTVELVDHLTHIFFDVVMPAIGVWVVSLQRKFLQGLIDKTRR